MDQVCHLAESLRRCTPVGSNKQFWADPHAAGVLERHTGRQLEQPNEALTRRRERRGAAEPSRHAAPIREAGKIRSDGEATGKGDF